MAQRQIETYRDPARNAQTVTPSDSTVLHESRGVWVGTGGDLAVLMANDTVPVTFVNVASGVMLPLSVTKVMSTGTDASDIVLVY